VYREQNETDEQSTTFKFKPFTKTRSHNAVRLRNNSNGLTRTQNDHDITSRVSNKPWGTLSLPVRTLILMSNTSQAYPSKWYQKGLIWHHGHSAAGENSLDISSTQGIIFVCRISLAQTAVMELMKKYINLRNHKLYRKSENQKIFVNFRGNYGEQIYW